LDEIGLSDLFAEAGVQRGLRISRLLNSDSPAWKSSDDEPQTIQKTHTEQRLARYLVNRYPLLDPFDASESVKCLECLASAIREHEVFYSGRVQLQ